VSHYYPPHIGGIENIVQKQVQSLAGKGHQISVVAFASSGESPASTKEKGIAVHRVKAINFFDKYFGIPFPIGGIDLVSRLWREIAKADIVHIHDVFYESSWIACIFARLKNKPVFLTQHVGVVKHPSIGVMLMQRLIYASFGRFIFGYGKKIIVYNYNVKTFLMKRGVKSGKVIELRNGVDLSLFRPEGVKTKKEICEEFGLPNDRQIVLFAGRLVPKKGIDIIYEARSKNYELVFAGPGEVPKKWQTTGGVHFLGSLPHNRLAELYRAADIFVFPSHGEIFTLVMQEAMASGLPVITTDDPAYKEYGIDGNLVAFIRPDADELKENINRIIADKQLRSLMRDYSIRFAKQWFDWNANIDQIIKLYIAADEKKQSAIVTTSWDDGHVLDLKLASLLKKFSIKGTFYISPQNREFEKSELLDENQIKLLSRDFEIGAHTLTHLRLSALSAEIAVAEISESKKYLETITGRPVESFCYPGGDYDLANTYQVEKSGFRSARTTKRFYFSTGENPCEIPTSVHAYDHWSDIWKIAAFAKFNPLKFFRYYRHWDMLAMAMFDHATRRRGVFHLWGHSWEIDRHNDWEKLEKVFEYISNHQDIKYLTNRELL
jgi:glycosyltransferase involved in cell wall biosynthesis